LQTALVDIQTKYDVSENLFILNELGVTRIKLSLELFR